MCVRARVCVLVCLCACLGLYRGCTWRVACVCVGVEQERTSFGSLRSHTHSSFSLSPPLPLSLSLSALSGVQAVLLLDTSKGHYRLPTTAKGNVQRNRVEKMFADQLKEGEGTCDPAVATMLVDCLSADTLSALDQVGVGPVSYTHLTLPTIYSV